MRENFKSDKACVVCGLKTDGMVTYHHLLTKKAHPESKNNKRVLISVCQNHHNYFHNKGTSYMASSYPAVKEWLIDNGWTYSEFLNKWLLN